MTLGTLLDRDLDARWLDRALAAAASGQPVPAARRQLEFSLRDTPLADEARKKTVTALSRTWLDPAPAGREVVRWAVAHAGDLTDTRPAHLGVLLATQPFFADVCRFVGRAIALDGTIATPDLRTRMKAKWGQRRSVDLATQRAVKTLRSLEIITGEPGSSVSSRGRTVIAEGPWISWLVHALLVSRGAESVGDRDLRRAPELFVVEWPTVIPNDYRNLERHVEGDGRPVIALRHPLSHTAARP